MLKLGLLSCIDLLIAIIENARLRIAQGYYECARGTMIYHWNVFAYCVGALGAHVRKQ